MSDYLKLASIFCKVAEDLENVTPDEATKLLEVSSETRESLNNKIEAAILVGKDGDAKILARALQEIKDFIYKMPEAGENKDISPFSLTQTFKEDFMESDQVWTWVHAVLELGPRPEHLDPEHDPLAALLISDELEEYYSQGGILND